MNSPSRSVPATAQVATPVRPQTQVEAWLKELDGSLGALDEALARHESRLVNVLRPEVPEKCLEGNAIEEMLVPTGEALRNHNRRIRFVIGRLNNITDRLEA
jgi:hypothetical protein